MIKPLKFEETPFGNKKLNKYQAFATDIREIIEKKIEYCELVDCPYAPSTIMQDLEYRARGVCRDVFWEKTGKSPEQVNFFKFSKLVDKDKKTHFYAMFAVKAWEAAINV